MNNAKLLSDQSLIAEGFSVQEVQAAAGRHDAYVGEKNGIKYYRAQNELNIELGEYRTREVRLPGQQGDRD